MFSEPSNAVDKPSKAENWHFYALLLAGHNFTHVRTMVSL